MWPWLIAGLVGWIFKDKIAEAVAPKPKYAPTPLPAPGGGASLVPSPTPGYAPYVAPTPAPEAVLTGRQRITLGPDASESSYPWCVPGDIEFVIAPCPSGYARDTVPMRAAAALECVKGTTPYPLQHKTACIPGGRLTPGFDGSTWGTKLYPPVPVQPQVPQPQTPQPTPPPKPTTPCPTGQEWTCIGTLLPGAGCSWRCMEMPKVPSVIVLKANESGPQRCGLLPVNAQIVIEPCPSGQVREKLPVAQIRCLPRGGFTTKDPRVGVGRCVAQATLTAPGQVGTPTAPRPGLGCTKIGYTVPAWIRPKCPARTRMHGLGVPANPTPRNTTQPDGTAITLRLVGDEFCHYTTSNGFPVVKRADGFWVYAKPNPSDTTKLVGTSLLVGSVCPERIVAKVQAGA